MPALKESPARLRHRLWDTVSSLWLTSLVTALLPHVLARDTWLFHTDPLTQMVYLGGLTGFYFLVWAALSGMIFAWFPAYREKARRKAMALAGAAFLGVVLVFSFRLCFPHVRTSGNLRSALFYGGWFGLAGLLMLAHPMRDSVLRRMLAVGRLGVLFWLAGLPMAYGALKWQAYQVSGHRAPGKKQVVLLVIDGMPSHLIHTFNPDQPPLLLDTVFSEGKVFTGVTSQHPWTNGWFGSFYTGRPYWRLVDEKNSKTSPNLFALLQSYGVKARWVVFHRNGIPEGSAAHTDQYRGLRSTFLGPRWGGLLTLLGLDYHVLAPDGGGNSLFQRNIVRRWVYGWLNSPASRADPLRQSLPQEMRRLHRSADRSFLLYHLHWSMVGEEADPAMASQEAGLGKVFHRIADQDYRYDLADTQAVAAARRERRAMARDLDSLGRALRGFLRDLDADPDLRDATILMTADHGTLAERGFLWYGRHAEEEVLRVPCVLLRGAAPGREAGRFSTYDLAATLMERLQVPTGLGAGGKSLLKSHGRDTVFALTLPSPQRGEWYLVGYVGDQRWRFNLFPGGEAKWDRQRVFPNFQSQAEDSGRGYPPSWQGWIDREIRENGIESRIRSKDWLVGAPS